MVVSVFGFDISSQVVDPTMRHFAILAIPEKVMKVKASLGRGHSHLSPNPDDLTYQNYTFL